MTTTGFKIHSAKMQDACLVAGYLRNNESKHIHSYSIPINLILDYYYDKTKIYKGMYLSKDQYFDYSVNIDTTIMMDDKQPWPENLFSDHNIQPCCKSAVISVLVTIGILVLCIMFITYTYINTSYVCTCVALITCMLLSGISGFAALNILSTTRMRNDNNILKLLKFNVDDQAIQMWKLKVFQLEKHWKRKQRYICQLQDIQNVCKFEELKDIRFMSNRNKTLQEVVGYIKFVKHDGYVDSISISAGCRWIETLSSLKYVLISTKNTGLNKLGNKEIKIML